MIPNFVGFSSIFYMKNNIHYYLAIYNNTNYFKQNSLNNKLDG